MNDIHAPTIASGPVSGGITHDLSKLSMPDLMKEKERIEEELSALSSVLQSVRSPIQKLLLLFLTL
jgi:26S proteasome non-ATPase regulatory subunit 9